MGVYFFFFLFFFNVVFCVDVPQSKEILSKFGRRVQFEQLKSEIGRFDQSQFDEGTSSSVMSEAEFDSPDSLQTPIIPQKISGKYPATTLADISELASKNQTQLTISKGFELEKKNIIGDVKSTDLDTSMFYVLKPTDLYPSHDLINNGVVTKAKNPFSSSEKAINTHIAKPKVVKPKVVKPKVVKPKVVKRKVLKRSAKRRMPVRSRFRKVSRKMPKRSIRRRSRKVRVMRRTPTQPRTYYTFVPHSAVSGVPSDAANIVPNYPMNHGVNSGVQNGNSYSAQYGQQHYGGNMGNGALPVAAVGYGASSGALQAQNYQHPDASGNSGFLNNGMNHLDNLQENDELNSSNSNQFGLEQSIVIFGAILLVVLLIVGGCVGFVFWQQK